MKNVLIIDDEKSLLFSMKEGFEPYKKQLNILTAHDGLEAVEILESTSVDLVVTDLKMPKMDGFEVIAHMSTNHNTIPVIVMTAFNTPEIESKLQKNGLVTIFEKPVDFDDFVKTVLQTINSDDNGKLSGISLSSFMQLIQSEQKNCLVEVCANNKRGYIFFSKGELIDATFDGQNGNEAIFKMLEFKEVQIGLKSLPQKKIKRRIKTNLMQMLIEAMQRADENQKTEKTNNKNNEPSTQKIIKKEAKKVSNKESSDNNKNTHSNEKGTENMADIKKSLDKFKGIEGLLAAGAFTPQGEQIAEINPGSVNIEELGALANDVLLKAQKATENMGVGRGQLVHIEAPKAHILARCLNESTDFTATTTGRAHVHMVVVIDQEGNIAMTKMKLVSIIKEIAEHFR